MSIIRYDLKLIARDRLAIASLIAFLLCVGGALALGHSWAERHRDALAAHLADPRFAMPEGTVSPTAFERPIVMPVPPLLDLTVGRSDLEPSHTATSFWAREDILFEDYQLDGPIALAAGRFDLAFVVIWLAPLLLIALGLSIVGADRDSGLLRMQAAASTTLGQRSLARAAVRWAIVFVPIALAAGLGAALAPSAPDTLLRLLLWLAAAGAYLLFWQAAILLISSFRVRQEALGAALFALWALIVTVIPAFGSATAQALNPPPSRFALIAEARATQVAARDSAPDELRRFMHDHPELVIGDVPHYVKSNATISGRIETAVRPTLERFDAARTAQREVASRFELLSPALLTHRLLADAAGSGEAAHAAFRAASLEYHRQIRETLLTAGLRGVELTRGDVDRIPSFALPATLTARIGGILGAIALLFAAAALIVAIALRRLSRPSATL